MTRPNSTQSKAKAEKIRRYWRKEGFNERGRELGLYPDQARQLSADMEALKIKNEAAGYYTLFDAADLLSKAAKRNDSKKRYSRMCVAWVQRALVVRDGETWEAIEPPEWPTDRDEQKKLLQDAEYGPSGCIKMFLKPVAFEIRSLDVVKDSDLDEWLQGIGAEDRFPKAGEGTSAAEPASQEIDFDMLAKREELIAAFGTFTGMNASWFDNLKDRPKLLQARRVAGKGGRNHTEPLFCPFQVMQWLISKPRKGDTRKAMSKETGWRMLKAHFLKVYCTKEIGDPKSD